MPKNIEIKARARDWDGQLARARTLTATHEQLRQHDTFFDCARDYLKLREFGDGSGELISYRRVKRASPKASEYLICPVQDAARLRGVLAAALGPGGTVRKDRLVLHHARTRIHFDEVQGLGRFIELEVVLEPDEDEGRGVAIARELMEALGIVQDDLIEVPYVEMMR